ncbi:MAG TPA: NAD-dependent deacylase [Terriglobia bacterium]
MLDVMSSAIDSLSAALRKSNAIVALTGAGISAESSIPTFRGAGGLWQNFQPEQLANLEAFERDPRLVWEWYDWRRGIISGAEPNRGHRALAEIERRKGSGFILLTQNVDGLQDRAGSRRVVKLHGDIWQMRCTECGTVTFNHEAPLAVLPPHCSCHALLRPGVVWFGESLPELEWQRAVEASQRADLFLLIGTSAVVYPAAGLAETAHQAGARVAVINLETTALDDLAEWTLRGSAGQILPRLLEQESSGPGFGEGGSSSH